MYNSLSALPTSLYKILEYLVVNNENIWKMLKYNSYDALSKPNLTVSEKLAFLWKTGPQEKYGMFLTNLVEDAICESKCIFKLYNYHVYASPSEYLSTAVYEFDFLYGDRYTVLLIWWSALGLFLCNRSGKITVFGNYEFYK